MIVLFQFPVCRQSGKMSRRTFVFYRRSRPHPGAIDTDKPVPYSVAVFRAPDNIQLELIHLPG